MRCWAKRFFWLPVCSNALPIAFSVRRGWDEWELRPTSGVDNRYLPRVSLSSLGRIPIPFFSSWEGKEKIGNLKKKSPRKVIVKLILINFFYTFVLVVVKLRSFSQFWIIDSFLENISFIFFILTLIRSVDSTYFAASYPSYANCQNKWRNKNQTM